MQEVQVSLEHPEVEARALSLPEQARGITIRDAESRTMAGEFLVGVKALRKEVDASFDPVIAAGLAAHRAAIAAKKRVETPIIEAETIVKRGLATYEAEQERRRHAAEEAARRERERLEAEARAKAEAERRRLEKEAEDRRLEEAAAAEARGDKETAERILDQPPEPVLFVAPEPVFTPPIEIAETPKLKGVSFREEWKFRVVNAALLPVEYTMPDEKKIGGVVRAMKGMTKIPGVEVYSEKSVAAGSR